ncbi:MAG: type VI secretion system baseplate subunit TssK [Pseudomonadota bacterium]
MANRYRVAWGQGMFLRPQHFQAQDRHFEAALRARTDTLGPWGWGLTKLKINEDLASRGQFSVEEAAGIMPDGTMFSIADEHPAPPAIEIPEDARDLQVSLSLMPAQPGANEFTEGANPAGDTRYLIESFDVIDTASADRESEPLELARPNLHFTASEERRRGKVSLGLARIREVRNNAILFDERYVPPCVDFEVSSNLSGAVSDITARCIARRDELARRAVTALEAGPEAMSNFILLQALNRAEQQLSHLDAMPMIHPERLYEAFACLSADIAASVKKDHLTPKITPYKHEDLRASFEGMIADIKDMLAVERTDNVKLFPMRFMGEGSYILDFKEAGIDNSIFESGQYLLAVRSQSLMLKVQNEFPGDAKVGPAHLIKRINQGALPGIPLTHLNLLPLSVRPEENTVYFKTDQSSRAWKEFGRARAMGVVVSSIWPEQLGITLVWVKDRQ